MNVSFTGARIYAMPKQYTIRNANNEEKTPKEDIIVNTDQIAYVTHKCCQRGAEAHMTNGDTIIFNEPFNAIMFEVAQKLDSNIQIGYTSNNSLLIEKGLNLSEFTKAAQIRCTGDENVLRELGVQENY